jgi:hypothetical protein
MTDKEKFEACMKIAEHAAENFHTAEESLSGR